MVTNNVTVYQFEVGLDEDEERRMQPARGRFARFDLDRQIASTFPAHWKVGPAPVFWASQRPQSSSALEGTYKLEAKRKNACIKKI